MEPVKFIDEYHDENERDLDNDQQVRESLPIGTLIVGESYFNEDRVFTIKTKHGGESVQKFRG